MDVDDAVKRLNDMGTGGEIDDKEELHIDADIILLAYVDPRIADAYDSLRKRVGGFWYA